MSIQIARRVISFGLVGLSLAPTMHAQEPVGDALEKPRPNILFCIADDWGWPHAGALGDKVVRTPNFDRIAREGALFPHAYVSSPSCTPSRNAILTGQWHWRLKEGANLWSTLDPKTPVYPKLLEAAGYHVGHWRKSWGPGRLKAWDGHPAGRAFKGGFEGFLAARPDDEPFCFWLGAYDPHRPYKEGTGEAAGLDPSSIELFPFFPDCPEVRGDVADYYHEVGQFDADVGRALALLEERGELENTIVVMTGDHGMPFPRCKGNVYDCGARVPLAIRWGAEADAGQVHEGFVSLTDLAPSFLAAAGVELPSVMTGRSLLPQLRGDENDSRGFVLIGRERHTPAQEKPQGGGYPVRALRTHDYLYVRNYEPTRWPAGTPSHELAYKGSGWLGDCDNGPTKFVIAARRELDEEFTRSWELCFGKRPAEELYDLKTDPHQLVNLALEPELSEQRLKMSEQLTLELTRSGDPRELGGAEAFDSYPYFGGIPSYPGDDVLEAYRE
jgi:N-sulfoglucosamine sulfohydrolase